MKPEFDFEFHFEWQHMKETVATIHLRTHLKLLPLVALSLHLWAKVERCPVRKSLRSSKVQNLCNPRCPASKTGSKTKIFRHLIFHTWKKSGIIEIKTGKMVNILEFSFQSYSKYLISEFFPFDEIIFHVTCSQLRHSLKKFQNFLKSTLLCGYLAPWKKLGSNVFKVSFDHLFVNLESGKRNLFFVLSGERLEVWMLKSI